MGKPNAKLDSRVNRPLKVILTGLTVLKRKNKIISGYWTVLEEKNRILNGFGKEKPYFYTIWFFRWLL